MKKLLVLLLVALGLAAIAYAISNRPLPTKETLPTRESVPSKDGSPGDPEYSPPTEPTEPTVAVSVGERA